MREWLQMLRDDPLSETTEGSMGLRDTKVIDNSGQLADTGEVELLEETLSDGSHVYAVRIHPHYNDNGKQGVIFVNCRDLDQATKVFSLMSYVTEIGVETS